MGHIRIGSSKGTGSRWELNPTLALSGIMSCHGYGPGRPMIIVTTYEYGWQWVEVGFGFGSSPIGSRPRSAKHFET
ncbi:hypothetical protein LWI28_015552 [Acer negundo]|uniref:Uncharacterized protein n=1 Tax=Acer negundo TaxID=4023 RepID=A0AAD5NFN8_ACENE|nr:hypothetical protein LWI28_015552 [Acer negundo]